jgi:hypothetical protein
MEYGIWKMKYDYASTFSSDCLSPKPAVITCEFFVFPTIARLAWLRAMANNRWNIEDGGWRMADDYTS